MVAAVLRFMHANRANMEGAIMVGKRRLAEGLSGCEVTWVGRIVEEGLRVWMEPLWEKWDV